MYVAYEHTSILTLYVVRTTDAVCCTELVVFSNLLL
jgi:hypothetical protein